MSTTTQTGNQPPSRGMLPSKEKKGLKKIMPIGCKIVGLTGCGFDPNVKPELLPDEDPDRLVWWVFDGDFPQSRPTEPYLYLPESVYYDEYFQSIVSYNEFKERSKKEQEGGEISKEEEDIAYGAWVYVETNERYGFGKVRNILSEDAQDTKIA